MIDFAIANLEPTKLEELQRFLCSKLDASIAARRNQVDNNYKRWNDNYMAKPLEAVRTTPYYNASNFVPQLIRMHSDILAARLTGIIFSAKPFWHPRSFLTDAIPHEALEILGEWLEYTAFQELCIFEPLSLGILQAVEDEIRLTRAEGSTVRRTEGVKLYSIPYDDFWPYPITARNLTETLIKFHRIRLTKEEVEYRSAQRIWNEEACKQLLTAPEDPMRGVKREQEATHAGIALTTDVDRPYNAIEAWLDYSLDGVTLDRIVVTFNPQLRSADGILRCIYGYYDRIPDCFIDIHLMPRDDLFYDDCVPQILEQTQEEQAQIHNARRDGNKIANVPGWKKKRYADVPNPTSEWYPGKVFELEHLDDLEPLQFSANYNSMIEEEQFLLMLAERYTGVGPPMQGMGAGTLDGKRGIYNSQGTLQVMSEGNRRLDAFVKRLREPLHTLGNIIFHSYRQFMGDNPVFQIWGEKGAALQQIFDLCGRDLNPYRGIFFDIGASDAGANKEIDRNNLLLMANTMAGYYRQIVEAASIITQIPDPNHPLRTILTEVLDGARDLASRLLFYYDIQDRSRLVPNVRRILEGGAAVQPGGALPGGPAGPQGVPGIAELQALSQYTTPIPS